jgi:hypothetical protein
MKESAKQAIRMWSELKKKRALPPELDLQPDQIIESPELHEKVKLAFDKEQANDKMWSEIDEKEKALKFQLKEIFLRVSDKYSNILKEEFCVYHLGAIGIAPSNIYIFCVVPSNKLVGELKSRGIWSSIEEAILSDLQQSGYPTDGIGRENIGLYSQEECNEKADGNWYYFFK